MNRETVLIYCQQSLKFVLQLDEDIAQFDNIFYRHNDLIDSDQASMARLVEAGARVAVSLTQLREAHSRLTPIPPEGASDYASWGSVYRAYGAWAELQHRLLLAVSQGNVGTGLAQQGAKLIASAVKQRKTAETKGRDLYSLLGPLSPSALRNLLRATPRFSNSERAAILEYLEKSLLVTQLQEQAGDEYNRLLEIHRERMPDADSLHAMIESSRALWLVSLELVSRQSALVPFPIVFAHYAAQTLMLSDYVHWADAQYRFFVALSESVTPSERWTREAMASFQRRLAVVKSEGVGLLRAIRVTPDELERYVSLSKPGTPANGSKLA